MAKSKCPTETALRLFNEGRLSLKDIDDVANHLGECSKCARQLESIRPSQLERGFRAAMLDDSIELEDPGMIESNVKKVLAAVAKPDESLHVDPHLGCNRFELNSKFAISPFSVDFLGIDQVTAAEVIIRFPHRNLFASVDHRAQLREDARTAIGLKHERIAPITRYGIWNANQPYLVAPYFNLHSLEQWLSNPATRIEMATLLAILGQVCQAVGYAHQQDVVHRHLSPARILVTPDGQVLVTEFGLRYDGRYQFELIEPLTAPTEFDSPESINNNPARIDHRADIFSLGALLAWLIDRVDLDSSNETHVERLTILARKCKRNSRRGRFQSVADLVEAVAGVFDS